MLSICNTSLSVAKKRGYSFGGNLFLVKCFCLFVFVFLTPISGAGLELTNYCKVQDHQPMFDLDIAWPVHRQQR